MGCEIHIARAVILINGKFLLARRALDDAYQSGIPELIGGEFNPGENAEAAMRRECLEELKSGIHFGLKYCEFRMQGESKKHRDDIFVVHGFIGRLVSPELMAISQEHIDIRLYELPELRKIQMTPESRLILQHMSFLD